MANEQLQIVIGANVKNLEQAISRAEKKIAKFKQATLRGAKGMDAMGKSTSNAVPALTSFSQVIQDAPYGIRGVANNITQLTSQFGYLSKSAGGAGGALRAMLGTLAGPAGILLGVSLVTSALVAFGDKLGSSANKADMLQKKLDKLNASFDAELSLNKEIKKTLELQGKPLTDNLNKRKEILNAQIDSISLLITEQQELLNIKKQANEIVSTWELIAGTAGNAWDSYKSWWLKNFNKFKKDVRLDEYREWWESNFRKGAELIGVSTDVDSASTEDLEKEKELRTKLNELLAKKQKLINQTLETEKELTNELGRQIQLSDVNQLTPKGSGVLMGSLMPNLSSAMGFGGQNVESPFDTEKIKATIPPFIATVQEGGEQALLAMQEFKDRTLALTNSVSSAFNSLGNNIANSLSQSAGVFGAFVGTIIQESLRLVKQLIVASIKGAAVTKASVATHVAAEQTKATASAIAAGASTASSAGPAAAILLPILIAGAVAAIGAAFAGIGGGGSKATSGVGGSGSGIGSNANFGTSYSSSSVGGGRVVFQIKGQDLYGVLVNYTNNQGRIGDFETIG